MLSRLVLINSAGYDMAEINFEDSNSLQLVGANNVGKSSLIFALNFVFLVNRKLMSFSGQRQADKETLAHYFPDADRSFILFQIKRHGRSYCLLVRRRGEADLQYARIDAPYERKWFFDNKKLRNFQDLTLFLNKELQLKVKGFNQAQEVLSQMYQVGTGNNAAVWLSSKCRTHGTTNSFTKVYRYLINARLIDNKALKDILLIADNRDQDRLSYNPQNIQQIDRLRQQSQQLTTLRAIRQEFDQFRSMVDAANEQRQLLHSQSAAFRMAVTSRLSELETTQHRVRQEIERLQEQQSKQQKRRDEINQLLGSEKVRVENLQQQRQQLDRQRQQIESLDPVNILEQQQEGLQEQLDQLVYQLQATKSLEQQSGQDLQQRLRRLQSKQTNLQAQYEDRDNWLIMHLSTDDDTRRLLNALLRDEVARLPQSALRKPISSAGDLIELFDGRIQLPPDFQLQALQTPEQLQLQIQENEAEIKRLEQLMHSSENRAILAQQSQDIRRQLQQLQLQVQQAQQLPDLLQQIEALQDQLQEKQKYTQKLEQELREKQETLRRMLVGINEKNQQLNKTEQELQQLRSQVREIEQLQLELPEEGNELAIGRARDVQLLFRQIREGADQIRKLQTKKNESFQNLRFKTNYDIADEQQFIQSIEQELSALTDKEKSIDALLNNIAVQFANPARKFLNDYEEFKTFIEQQFNYNLGKIKISNIESLTVELEANERLHHDLQKIEQLSLQSETLFNQGQETNERFEVLRNYLERGQAIEFSELFDLRLRLTVNGKQRSVNLGRQVESDGTDRMLRLIIILTVINRLTVRSPENRIVLFIDEIATIDGKNRPQLVQFCNEHHYYPIFAAPDIVPDFDRYVFITRNAQGGLIIDEDKHYVNETSQKETAG